MEQGLTVVMAWLAVLGYAVSLWLLAKPERHAAARPAWALSWLAYLLHVASAFHFHHHWSHNAAWEFTAQQTEAMVGLAWGGGLYLNYLFTLVWGADVGWWFLWPRSYQARPRLVGGLLHGFLGFLVFNAAVVFAVGWRRWLGMGIVLLLLFRFSNRHQ